MSEKKGLFIVFDGIDGCGKSTQLKKFVDHFFYGNKYRHLVLTREPYAETDIRKILFEGESPEEKSEKLTELFLADRKKHSDELILPSLEKGFHVISDRYKHSTIAYQTAQGMDKEKIVSMHDGLPIPDITFVFDVSSETAKKRMGSDEGRKKHKFEKDQAFLERVRNNFKDLPNVLSEEKVFVIDANRGVEEIFSDVKAIFEREFGGKNNE